eukprot:m.14754 g.14754  ORF g.14754 m.14754 type:complete len:91 (-) comp8121_c0_seq1:57-329(-)
MALRGFVYGLGAGTVLYIGLRVRLWNFTSATKQELLGARSLVDTQQNIEAVPPVSEQLKALAKDNIHNTKHQWNAVLRTAGDKINSFLRT